MVDKECLSGMENASPKCKAIVRAAEKRFLKNGYQATSMDEIAHDADVSKQTIYSHFGSKDVLFSQVMTGICHSASPSCPLEGKDIDELSLKSVLDLIADSFFNMLISPKSLALFRIVVQDSAQNPDLAQTFMDTGPKMFVTSFAEMLMHYKNKGDITIESPTEAAMMFCAMLKGHVYMRFLLDTSPKPTQEEIQQHLDNAVTMFIKAHSNS